MRRRLVWMLFLILFARCGQSRKSSELVWDINLPRIGSQSSPRVTDLNEDGVLDIVIGAGQNEYQHSKQGILALDGKTGAVLWQQEAPDQVYGSATFYDINDDGVKDVFIGGRSPHFFALDGKKGSVIWEYEYHYEDHPVMRHAKFNFNNSVLVPDQNKDGLMDLLTVNGGNSLANPGLEHDRFPGVLILFDIKTGQVLAADTMPDGKESYMSPVCFLPPDGGDLKIIYGTGGETIDGHLYMVTLQELMKNDLSNSKIIASENGHGFIAPPVVADVSKDGYPDIIAISHGSTIFAINGKDNTYLWQQKIRNTESSNSFAVGYFTGDDVPDVFTFVSKGQWPENTGSLQVMLDGKDGSISFIDSLGCTGFSSPVVYDLNNDHYDEVLISINEFPCSGFTSPPPDSIVNKLVAINFRKNSVQVIDQQMRFKNIFSTPWLGDLDDDGYLDIIHAQYFHHSNLLLFLGMRLKRISTPIQVKQAPVWGAYMGSNGDGVFDTNQ